MRIGCELGVGVRITGTPRIGKSIFLFYVARQLEQGRPGQRGFIISIGENTFVHVGNGKYTSLQYRDAEISLFDSSVIHLIDPLSCSFGHQEHNAFAVFFTSPTVNNILPYHLKNLKTFYMPLWTENELTTCRNNLNLKIPAKDIHDKWGGVFVNEWNAECFETTLFHILSSTDVMKLL